MRVGDLVAERITGRFTEGDRVAPVGVLAGDQAITIAVFSRSSCVGRLCALIDKCWAENPDARPSYAAVQEILQGLFAEAVQSRPKVATTVIGSK